MKSEALLKLKRLKNQIELMPDNNQKNLLLMNYFHLFFYLQDSKIVSDVELNQYFLEVDISNFTKLLNKNNKRYINELIKNNSTLLKIDFELYNTYLQGNWNKNSPIYNISNYNGTSLLESFFKTLGNDILNIYQNIKEKNISYLKSDFSNTDGACYGFNGDNYSYINVKKTDNNISSYIALVHEIGHVYQYYLLRNHANICYYSIIDEVMSLLFEKLFFKYLAKHHYYYFMANDLYHQYYVNHFWLLMDLLLTSALFKENAICQIDTSLICQTSFNEENVINLALELGYQTDSMPKLNLYDYPYVIGDIISDYFIKIMDGDFNKGFKEACNFIQEANCYSLKEILDKYCSDLSYTKENLKSVIEKGKSYQKRK